MIERTSELGKNLKLFFAISLFALIGGQIYVMALESGFRGFIYIHGGILFFFGVAVFLRNIKAFLIFAMLFGLAFGFGRHIIHHRPEFESVLFSTGIRIDAVEAVLIICYAHWGLTLAQRDLIIRPITIGGKVGRAFLGWILCVFLTSFLSASHLDFSLYEVIVYTKGFLLYFYLVNNVNNEDDLRLVIYAICGACVLQSLYMIAQWITKTSYTIHGDLISYIGPEGFRSRGFYGSPDAHATFLVTVFPVLFIASFIVKDVFKKSAIITSIFMILLAIIFSKVRIAFAALGFSVLTSLLISYRRRWLSEGQILIALVMTIFTVIATLPFVYERFAYGTYGEDRWPLIVTAYNMFMSNIVFGVGANNYNFVVLKYIPPDLSTTWLFTVHNEYFLRLTETGFIGFLFYYFLMITVTMRFYKATFSKKPLIFLVSCGLFASMIGSYVHRMVSMYHYQQVFMLQCTIYALCVVIGLLEKSKTSQTNNANMPKQESLIRNS